MSKWFNARFKSASAALVLISALGACGGGNDAGDQEKVRASTVVEPETIGIDTVPEEEPALARAQWRAANDVTRQVAGNLRVSLEGTRGGPVIFAFANGVTIRAQSIDVVPANTRSGVEGQSFAGVVGGDPRVRAHVYRVLEDNVTRSAVRGGLCGQASTTHLAVSEYVDSTGNWVFKVAAFKGERRPGAPGQDPEYCGAYAYAAIY